MGSRLPGVGGGGGPLAKGLGGGLPAEAPWASRLLEGVGLRAARRGIHEAVVQHNPNQAFKDNNSSERIGQTHTESQTKYIRCVD